MVRWDHSSVDMSVSQLGEIVKDREARHAAVHGVTKSLTRLSYRTELNILSHSLEKAKVGTH